MVTTANLSKIERIQLIHFLNIIYLKAYVSREIEKNIALLLKDMDMINSLGQPDKCIHYQKLINLNDCSLEKVFLFKYSKGSLA